MRFTPTTTGGRVATGDTPYGAYRVEWDQHGQLVSQSITIRRPPEHIPDGFDPATERDGCCDPPPDAEVRASDPPAR